MDRKKFCKTTFSFGLASCAGLGLISGGIASAGEVFSESGEQLEKIAEPVRLHALHRT